MAGSLSESTAAAAALQRSARIFLDTLSHARATFAMSLESSSITELLGRWKDGDRAVESELISAVYPVLREIARSQVRRQPGQFTLQATELANEAYAKLFQQRGADWKNRDHFYAIAAMVIRRVVIDYARLRGREKRGGGTLFIALDQLQEEQSPLIDDSFDWLALDAALNELARFDADCARVVELKFFSGLTSDKIAEVEGRSRATVNRQWRFARAWLGNYLGVGVSPAQ
jgi:RNA polymerase sigma factor (TIGR02999 family)